jgi:hypothetical protein
MSLTIQEKKQKHGIDKRKPLNVGGLTTRLRGNEQIIEKLFLGKQ